MPTVERTDSWLRTRRHRRTPHRRHRKPAIHLLGHDRRNRPTRRPCGHPHRADPGETALSFYLSGTVWASHELHWNDFGPGDGSITVRGERCSARVGHKTIHSSLGRPLIQLNLQRLVPGTVTAGSLQHGPAVFAHQRQYCIFVGDQGFIHARMRPQKNTECQLHDAILARPRRTAVLAEHQRAADSPTWLTPLWITMLPTTKARRKRTWVTVLHTHQPVTDKTAYL